MGLGERARDLVGRFLSPRESSAEPPVLEPNADSEGYLFLADAEVLKSLRNGVGDRQSLERFILLRMLIEQERVQQLPNGYQVVNADAVALADDEAEVLGLPPRFTGLLETEVSGATTSSRFNLRVRAKRGEYPEPFEVVGAELRIDDDVYLCSVEQREVLDAIASHQRVPLGQRTEEQNVALIAKIKAARAHAETRGAAPIGADLGHLEEFDVVEPERVRLLAEPQPDGSLLMRPDLGAEVEPEALDRRWHHVDKGSKTGVVRVGSTLVALNEDRLAAVRDVQENAVIPAHQVQAFMEAPGAFYDASLIDLEFGFSARVRGLAQVVSVPFAMRGSSGINWFDGEIGSQDLAPRLEAHTELAQVEADEEIVREAWDRGESMILLEGAVFDIFSRDRTTFLFDAARSRLAPRRLASGAFGGAQPTVAIGAVLDDVETEAARLRELAEAAVLTRAPAVPGLSRTPMPHQDEGLAWLAGLMRESESERGRADNLKIMGALLADDMGLGKTFTILCALAAHREWRRQEARKDRPDLVVLPLSLVENWEGEIAQAFASRPWSEVVILQASRDLQRFRKRGARRETRVDQRVLEESGSVGLDAVRHSLLVGPEAGPSRLDQPGRLVITTYETLRDYQLSLAQIDWGTVVFDEAQNIKSPAAQKTHAAKALRAQFKLVVTGTPVENGLEDLWCLMDTAQPGLLGTWSEFRDTWIPRSSEREDDIIELDAEGLPLYDPSALRRELGVFMLRRTKEEHLRDLPTKTIHSPFPGGDDITETSRELAIIMPSTQSRLYSTELANHRDRVARTPAAALQTLQKLQSIALHPALAGVGRFDGLLENGVPAARFIGLKRIVDQVRERGEKVIVFVIRKEVQRALAAELTSHYGIPVDVINGDTRAVSGAGVGKSRRELIRDFEARSGFGIIIMSPIAAGVGLTVVGANHAVFLERHWNPAKEAQATDRIYRIGQKRDVHVYLPAALHPEVDSFDLALDRLLRKKTAIKDSVLTPTDAASESDLMHALQLIE